MKYIHTNSETLKTYLNTSYDICKYCYFDNTSHSICVEDITQEENTKIYIVYTNPSKAKLLHDNESILLHYSNLLKYIKNDNSYWIFKFDCNTLPYSVLYNISLLTKLIDLFHSYDENLLQIQIIHPNYILHSILNIVIGITKKIYNSSKLLDKIIYVCD